MTTSSKNVVLAVTLSEAVQEFMDVLETDKSIYELNGPQEKAMSLEFANALKGNMDSIPAMFKGIFTEMYNKAVEASVDADPSVKMNRKTKRMMANIMSGFYGFADKCNKAIREAGLSKEDFDDLVTEMETAFSNASGVKTYQEVVEKMSDATKTLDDIIDSAKTESGIIVTETTTTKKVEPMKDEKASKVKPAVIKKVVTIEPVDGTPKEVFTEIVTEAVEEAAKAAKKAEKKKLAKKAEKKAAKAKAKAEYDAEHTYKAHWFAKPIPLFHTTEELENDSDYAEAKLKAQKHIDKMFGTLKAA